MALDFYRLGTKEHLFGLEDKQFEELGEIFNQFKFKTGLFIDQYGRFKMTKENQLAIIEIISENIKILDLNKNKSKAITLIEFRALLKLFSSKNIDLYLQGD